MNKTLRERIHNLFTRPEIPPVITENSSLRELARQFPHLYEFIERKYGVKMDVDQRLLSLKDFVEKFGLPPAQILFMEIQTSVRTRGIKKISAKEAKKLIEKIPTLKILDVREQWETKLCKLPNSQVFSTQILDEILTEWPKQTEILLYCHFGIRSLDAATFLADRGFEQVFTLSGGIDAWSVDVDSAVPRYENAWC
jgi:rhodanese-related sulfurtransferase